MTENEFNEFLKTIKPAYKDAVIQAEERQAKLAKPPKSLGKLEDISIKLSGITGKLFNKIENCRVLVFAADNGVVEEGVASTPKSVTLQQSINMTRHLTGMSSIAEYFGCSCSVIDVGIDSDLCFPGILNRKIRRGTRNFAKEPAMTRSEVLLALSCGIEAAKKAKQDNMDAVGIGEMGIGNTTTSAAVLACLTGSPVEDVTGRGSGLTDDAFALKKRVIADAINKHKPDGSDPLDVLCKVGGLDIAAMTGAFLGCAALRIPAVVDGFISIVAALTAFKLCPAVRDFIFLSHASFEIGSKIAAKELSLEPCLLLGMRLGEGSGCPIAFQIMKAACAAMNGMATFEEAAINDDYLSEIRTDKAFIVKDEKHIDGGK